MAKKMNEAQIANELSEGSLFFQEPTKTRQKSEMKKESKTQETDQSLEIPGKQSNTPPPEIPSETKDDQQIELIRRALKKFGKEAATYRFTREEKSELSKIVYTYRSKNIRTSENEITRIAVNALVSEYKQKGETSLLHKILELLHN